MAASSKGPRFHQILQRDLSPDDKVWKFRIPNLPDLRLLNRQRNSTTTSGEKLLLLSVTVTHHSILLKLEESSINRVLSANSSRPEEVLHISFEKFRFPDELPKVTTDYIERLLLTGIQLNGRNYIFYGHSNSQLKSRSCLLLNAPNGEAIMRKISEFGDFSKFMSVAKRAKRIGLLFSAAEASVTLDKRYTLDIEDVESDGHIFTDGCGSLSQSFAVELAKRRNVVFQNTRYAPSAFQIRYKGYKGMLMVNWEMDKENRKTKTWVKVQFRASMKKFKDCPDDSFSVLDYSKPFSYAFLNGELITLLSALGIPDEVFLQKQNEYFNFLEGVCSSAEAAYKYLCYKAEYSRAEEVLLGGITPQIQTKIKGLTRAEWKGTYRKNEISEGNERCRIMIPDSRILFGVCDYTGTLKEGECHVRITSESGGQRSLDGGYVVVSRNPCLHPGDIRKFRPVRNEGLDHLVDCIVFPIVGIRDAASLMSGGDLDGDKFFVCWDKDLMPRTMFQPYGYPPAKETTRRDIDYINMVEYFARYNNASLGRVKNLYLDWCRGKPLEGAGSKECQELNKLFSSCVDGERIRIPEHLENPPKPEESSGKEFIVDLLCKNIRKVAETIFRKEAEFVDLTTREVLEEILAGGSDGRFPSLLDEYRLYLLALRWCQRHHELVDSFIHYFDFGCFTTIQKLAVLSNLRDEAKYNNLEGQYFGQVFNALHQSQLLSKEELKATNLSSGRVRWQKLYSSFQDAEGQRLPGILDKAMEHFDKKLIVFQVEANLRIAIYIPKRIDKYAEVDVGSYRDVVKLFAFEPMSGQTHKKDTGKCYRMFFDGEILQLFEKKRSNSFVWFALNEAYAERNRIESQGLFKASIALQKFNYRLSKSQPRVQKRPSSGIEIYVISNRDREGHQLIENSMNAVETTEIKRNLENIPKDYTLTGELLETPGETPEFVEHIVVAGNLEELRNLENLDQFKTIFEFCLQNLKYSELLEVLRFILENFEEFGRKHRLLDLEILNLVGEMPSISILITQSVYAGLFRVPEDPTNGNDVYFALTSALILTTNEFHETSLNQFQIVLDVMRARQSGNEFNMSELTRLVKLILLTVRDFVLAKGFLDLLFLPGELTPPISPCLTLAYYKRFLLALTLEYLEEVQERCPCDFWGLPIGAEVQNETQDTNPPKNHLTTLPTFADFFQTKRDLFSDNDNEVPLKKPANAPEPHQRCLEIQACETPGFFETILRSDVLCQIRNEDHLRFCASKRSSDKTKRRITVFDAVAVSVIRGKLQFRILQKPLPLELTAASWNVYICGSTTELNTMTTALYNLVTLGEEATTAFNSILGINPKIGSQIPSTPPIDTCISNKFNESQSNAVSAALNNPLTLIWGPPGTGKTTVVVEIILNFLRAFPAFRILVTASTNNAVDNVMERFLKERVDSKSDDAIRLASDISKISPNLKRWTLDAFVGGSVATDDKAKSKATKKLKEAVLVFSTCSSAGVGLLRSSDEETTIWPKNPDDKAKKTKKQPSEHKFDVVIVDEASQLTEPNAIIPIVKASKYVVLVGDHVQLRPTLKSEIAKEHGLETSLFERLYLTEDTSAKKVMLNTQYRMHPDLCKFSSKEFYGGKLLSGLSSADRVLTSSKFPWPEDQFPFVFVNCPSPEDHGCKSKRNAGQAKMAVQIVKMLKTQEAKIQVNVLTPYTNQLTLIKKEGGAGVEVNTIDGFQGREADVIVFCTVRANHKHDLGFLDDLRRMNVAVTRARYGLIVIGHEETLKENQLWNSLLNYARKLELKPEK